jgi:hypothetical protein
MIGLIAQLTMEPATIWTIVGGAVTTILTIVGGLFLTFRKNTQKLMDHTNTMVTAQRQDIMQSHQSQVTYLVGLVSEGRQELKEVCKSFADASGRMSDSLDKNTDVIQGVCDKLGNVTCIENAKPPSARDTRHGH